MRQALYEEADAQFNAAKLSLKVAANSLVGMALISISDQPTLTIQPPLNTPSIILPTHPPLLIHLLIPTRPLILTLPLNTSSQYTLHPPTPPPLSCHPTTTNPLSTHYPPSHVPPPHPLTSPLMSHTPSCHTHPHVTHTLMFSPPPQVRTADPCVGMPRTREDIGALTLRISLGQAELAIIRGDYLIGESIVKDVMNFLPMVDGLAASSRIASRQGLAPAQGQGLGTPQGQRLSPSPGRPRFDPMSSPGSPPSSATTYIPTHISHYICPTTDIPTDIIYFL